MLPATEMSVKNICLSVIILSFGQLCLSVEMDGSTDSKQNNVQLHVRENISQGLLENSTSQTAENRVKQSQKMIHNAFSQMDRGTVIRGTIVLTGFIILLALYIGTKRFLLRKKYQPRRYTLITNPATMEESLFAGHENEDEEIQDDTFFVRK